MSDISIVIPTRNRHKFLVRTVQTILDMSSDIELIIVDNSDNELNHDFVCGNNKLKYTHSNENMSVVDNFEKAMKFASRKYICFLGDDDLISSRIDEILSLLDGQKLDCIYPWNDGYIAHFIWPGVVNASGELWMSEHDFSLKSYSPRNSIKNAIRFPGKGPANLPKVYQGIVSRSLVDAAIKKYGHVFGGVSPDIYSGLLLASCAKSVTSINYPFVIPGASVMSTAGEGILKTDRDKNKAAREHIKRFGDSLMWPEYIPDVYTSHTVWALSLISAIETIGLNPDKKNMGFLYLDMLHRYPEYKKEILFSLNCLSNSNLEKMDILRRGVVLGMNYYIPRAAKKIVHSSKKIKKIEFEDIEEIPEYVK